MNILKVKKMNRTYYFEWCKECSYLYHCYGSEDGERIENDDVNDMYLRRGGCSDYYPEIKC